jgi:hypothetical protein
MSIIDDLGIDPEEVVRQAAGGQEYEQLSTLATLRGLRCVRWDALGQVLFVEFVAGPPDRPVAWPVGMTPEVVEQLPPLLHACLSERPFSEGPTQ